MKRSHNIGARAFGAFALLFCAALLGGCATVQDDWEPVSALSADADHAIYVARIDEMTFTGQPPCPPENICMSAFFDHTASPIEMIAGNPNINTQT